MLRVDKATITAPSGKKILDQVSLELVQGSSLGIVGESGSGKTMLCSFIMGMIPFYRELKCEGEVAYHTHRWHNSVPLHQRDRAINNYIAYIPQDPYTGLNPMYTVGRQLTEQVHYHHKSTPKESINKAHKLLREVGLDAVERFYQAKPHQLSGGQLQRVNIALALAAETPILLCDEITTALDTKTENTIVSLLAALVEQRNITLIFVSHDLPLVGRLCDSILVLRQGRRHAWFSAQDMRQYDRSDVYVRSLWACHPAEADMALRLPTIDNLSQRTSLESRPIRQSYTTVWVTMRDLVLSFPLRTKLFVKKQFATSLIKGFTLDIIRGEVIGIVGPSGSGKTTLGKCIANIEGKYQLNGVLTYHNNLVADDIYMIFQDSHNSLNPKMTIRTAVAEIFYYKHKRPWQEAYIAAEKLLHKMNISSAHYEQLPAALSGGQRQRVAIAKALATAPKILICDEVVSSLDASTKADILNILDQIVAEKAMTMLFISHDWYSTRYISDRIFEIKDHRLHEQSIEK